MSQEQVEPIYVEVGRRIKKARDAKNVSQAVLGERVGLTRTSIANIEGGYQRVLLHTLDTIANSLGVDLAHLLFDDGLPAAVRDTRARPPTITVDKPLPTADEERILKSVLKRKG